MSLGGYKFAGRYCEKGSLTNQQWARRIHEAKISAFMAANSLSNAGWDYDMSGSPDGNTHCLDSVGNNYVTVFKRTNSDGDYTWFSLYTLTYYTYLGTNTGAAKIWIINNKIGSQNYYIGYRASNFYRIGTSQISYDDSLDTDPDLKKYVTPLLPMGNIGANSSDITSSYYPPSNTSASSASTVYTGFAIKEDNIIMFLGVGSYNSSYLCCSLASGHAYSALLNDNDTATVFSINFQSQSTSSSGYEISQRLTSTNSTSFLAELCVSVRYDGTPSWPDYISCIPLADYTNTSQLCPYQSVSVLDVLNDISGIKGKGFVKVDLMAINESESSTNLTVYSTVANGNYLVVLSSPSTLKYNVINTSLTVDRYTSCYVGWDTSNPDITQSSSWLLYNGD